MASMSSVATVHPAATVDSDAGLSSRQKRKKNNEAAPAATRTRPAPTPAEDEARRERADARLAERNLIKTQVTQGQYKFDLPPTSQSVTSVLTMLQNLVLVQEEPLRDRQTGRLILTAFERTDPIGALARGVDNVGDAPQAGRKALAISQRMYDFVTAVTAVHLERPDKLARGREASLDPNERKDEAPPWPASKNGYVRFNDVIAHAASPEGKEAFWGWAETPTDADAAATEALRQAHPDREIPDAPPRIPNARIVCPAGAIAMPPLYVAAPARKSKSVPMITVIGIALQIPGAVVAVSVAPNKIGPLTELVKKVEKTGWTEAGIAIIASTLAAQLGRNADPAATIRNFHASNLFFYSHQEAQDINAFVAWAEHKIAIGRAIISVHDEADTLTKKQLDPDAPPTAKVPAIQRLWPYFSLSKALTILVGATLIPTLEDDSLMGSILHDDPHDAVADLCDEGILIPPLEPTDQGQQYIGIEHCVGVQYDAEDPNNPFAFTQKLVLSKMKRMRGTCRFVQREGAEAKLQLAQNKPVVPQVLDEDAGTVETQEQAQVRHIAAVARKQKALDTVKAKTIGDFYKPDKVPQTTPSMPDGSLHLFYDEPATAMLAACTAAHIAREPLAAVEKARPGDPEEHVLSKALVVSCCSTQQVSATDLGGGLGGYTKLATQEAIDQGKVLCLLLYTSIGKAGITKTTGMPADDQQASNPSDQVKLFLVRPMADDASDQDSSDDDSGDESQGGYRWACCPFTAHEDAPSALAHAHAVLASKGFEHLLPEMRLIYVGYDMFAASTTLSCSDHTLVVNGATMRVHYLPYLMVLCHTKLKQLNVLYQMLGRSMNLLQSIKLANYKIDVLTHGNTLLRVKCYYLIEQYMIKCMKGLNGIELRQPDQMMGALVQYANEQCAAYGLAAHDFLSTSRVGLRNVPIAKALARGKQNRGARHVRLADIHQLPTEASSGGSDDTDADDEYRYDDDDDEEALPPSAHEVVKDNFGWRGCIDRPPAEWPGLYDANGGPHYATKPTGTTPDAIELAHKQFIGDCTAPEKAAILPVPKFNAANVKISDGQAALYDPKWLAPHTDLLHRMLPCWFAVAWILQVHKQWDSRPSTWSLAERVTWAKKEADHSYRRVRAALSFLICTNQFVPIPNEENWIVQLKEFGRQLGDSKDRREQALKHMLRVFAWNTKQSSNHQNHVTALHLFLERLNKCLDVKAEPWNMRELKQKPLWLEANGPKIIGREPHVNDADVCQHDQYVLNNTHDPDAQPMDYLTLP